MEATIRRETETSIHDLGATTRHGARIAEVAQKRNGVELRAKMQTAIEKAKALCQPLQEKALTAAKATDRTVRTHPYQAIGIVIGLGMLIGAVVMRRKRGRDQSDLDTCATY